MGARRCNVKLILLLMIGILSVGRLLKQHLNIVEFRSVGKSISKSTISKKVRKFKKKKSSSIPERLEELILPTSKNPNLDPRSYYNKPIRNWGCHNQETPLIFVHIGKAGGGSIRARLAAAAVNYTRGSEKWSRPKLDNHYYPIDGDDTNVENKNKAYFCNSRYKHHRISNSTLYKHTFEGLLPCSAITPIGMAMACPEPYNKTCLGCQDLESDQCNTIYAGHNYLGSELHWLPPRYSQNWFQKKIVKMITSPTTPLSSSSSSLGTDTRSSIIDKENGILTKGFDKLLPRDKRWCLRFHKSRPRYPYVDNQEDSDDRKGYQIYNQCSTVLSMKYDSIFQELWKQQQSSIVTSAMSSASHGGPRTDYSSLYASMPVQRITMIREPFSWLLSKFYWHSTSRKLDVKCDDVVPQGIGWIQKYSLDYILHLCGDDCANRFDLNLSASLDEFEQQAANNLRKSFAVVGILNETETFYDMITRRVKYMNMSLNKDVEGANHKSVDSPTKETERCKAVFQTPEFQNFVKQRIPIVATLERLYNFGIQVNRHQMTELATCN